MCFNAVFIGNIALDVNSFYYGKKEEQLRTNNIGGACFYSAIPASLFYRVGMVGKVGSDFDINIFSKYNVDTKGIKIFSNEKTISFHQIYKSKNQKIRKVEEYLNPILVIMEEDIPREYLKSKYIHITTNEPEVQLKLVKFIRKNSNAIISIDTIGGYSKEKTTKEVFDLVDIAFIDKEFTNLINCKAKVKIIKKGAEGCDYVSDNKQFSIDVVKTKVVDKTGAGDCMNGVFINLIANGWEEKEALKMATRVATESIKENGIEHLKRKNIHNL